jgi:hypothetical protein
MTLVMVDAAPFGSATVGYGSTNTHDVMMGQHGHQEKAGNGAMDGNTGYTTIYLEQ